MNNFIRHILLALCFLPFIANAQQIEFQGYPVSMASTDGKKSNLKELSKKESLQYVVTITKSGENYFWASRGNTPLIKIVSGAFITYLAPNGAGYVRIIDPALKQSLCSAKVEVLDCSFTYVEHMTTFLASITYYGN